MKPDTKIRCSPEESEIFKVIRAMLRSNGSATIEIDNGKITVTSSKNINAA
jgi:hypothetical protein